MEASTSQILEILDHPIVACIAFAIFFNWRINQVQNGLNRVESNLEKKINDTKLDLEKKIDSLGNSVKDNSSNLQKLFGKVSRIEGKLEGAARPYNVSRTHDLHGNKDLVAQ